MGAIIDMLNQKRFASIPESFEGNNLLTGELLEICVPNRGSLEGILFLSDRYLDMKILWNNMSFKDINADDEKFPQRYVIDKSAILLMDFAIDDGLFSLGCGQIQAQISAHKTKVQNENNSIFDYIRSIEE